MKQKASLKKANQKNDTNLVYIWYNPLLISYICTDCNKARIENLLTEGEVVEEMLGVEMVVVEMVVVEMVVVEMVV